jgi:uncharacterized protein
MSPEIIIADSSSIIILHETALLHLLPSLYSRITITKQVEKEIQIAIPEWMKVEEPSNKKLVNDLLRKLDEGEASSIALAVEHKNSLLIIDEKDGRKIAASFNIQIIGTLGILLQAKRKNLISSFKDCLNKIVSKGFRVSPLLIEKFLNESGESNQH